MRSVDVCLCAKIRILKQITTTSYHSCFGIMDVCLCAKIRILKQITTVQSAATLSHGMFVFVQRYEF